MSQFNATSDADVHAFDERDDPIKSESPGDSTIAVLSDDSIDRYLMFLRLNRVTAIAYACLGVGFLVIIPYGVGKLILFAFFGPGPQNYWGAVLAIPPLVIMVMQGWFGAWCKFFLKMFYGRNAIQCPECDAALAHNLSAKCSCCEQVREADLFDHWSGACPSCKLKPDAVACWRCESLIRVRDTGELRAINLLQRPTT